jgi:hypothetical protein
MAKTRVSRPLLILGAGLALAGCVNFSALDDLKTAVPPSDPFSAALFKNYAFLARTFGDVGQAQYTSFDQDASIPIAETDATVADLANTYASKALQLSNSQLVDPEISRDVKSHELRERLVRALAAAHDAYPRDAARAQADWDCWRLNGKVASQAAAAEQCRASFDVTLPRLEGEAAIATAEKAKEDAEKKKLAEQQKQQAGGADLSEMP